MLPRSVRHLRLCPSPASSLSASLHVDTSPLCCAFLLPLNLSPRHSLRWAPTALTFASTFIRLLRLPEQWCAPRCHSTTSARQQRLPPHHQPRCTSRHIVLPSSLPAVVWPRCSAPPHMPQPCVALDPACICRCAHALRNRLYKCAFQRSVKSSSSRGVSSHMISEQRLRILSTCVRAAGSQVSLAPRSQHGSPQRNLTVMPGRVAHQRSEVQVHAKAEPALRPLRTSVPQWQHRGRRGLPSSELGPPPTVLAHVPSHATHCGPVVSPASLSVD